jgi:PAS domain S-box
VAAGVRSGIWVAAAGGVGWFDGTNWSRFKPEHGLCTPYVKRVHQARNGDVYLLNGNREVEIISGNKVVAHHPFSGWPTAMAEDSVGVVVSVGGDLFRVDRQRVAPHTFPSTNGPQFHWIRNLHSCSDGSILISTVNGLFRADGERLEHWSVPEGLPDYDVQFACEDDQKTIWIGQRTGLSRLKNDRITPIKDPLVETVIHGIVPDAEDNLWVAATHGIIQVSRRSANAVADEKSGRLVGRIYDGLESIKTIESADVEWVGCRSTEGAVWFPTPQGPVRIDPRKIPVNSVIPPVHLLAAKVNGVDVLDAGHASVGPGSGELQFQFTGISLQAPEKVRFRYKLEGYDSDWVDSGPRRSAVYANLKPRDYTFRVQACNADGLWNEQGASLAVTLPPYYYQSTWFKALVAMAGVALLGGIYAWRVSHIQRRSRLLKAANEQLDARIRERTRELSEQRNLLRTLIDHLPDDIFVKDRFGRVLINNIAHARTMGFEDPEQAAGRSDFDCYTAADAERFRATEENLLRTGEGYEEEEHVTFKNGQVRWQRTTKVPLRDHNGDVIGVAGIHRDVTERKKAEAELEDLHKRLLQSSRQAGMAEVATSVLHNVGNVLNSVNISASIIEEQVRSSSVERLEKVLELLKENSSSLTGFFAANGKGDKLIHFLETLYRTLLKERTRMQEEIQSLNSNIDHIKKIVAMQQTYARVSGVVERIPPSELAEDALRIQSAGLSRNSIRLVRDFHPDVPMLTIDRHKTLQILVNLLENAKNACEANDPTNRIVRFTVRPASPDRVRFEVRDNGVGILPENLTKIFAFGFTTRKNGHGFGLHSGALAAHEMGGALTAHSDGHGKGAHFILELPTEPGAPAKSEETKGDAVLF